MVKIEEKLDNSNQEWSDNFEIELISTITGGVSITPNDIVQSINTKMKDGTIKKDDQWVLTEGLWEHLVSDYGDCFDSVSEELDGDEWEQVEQIESDLKEERMESMIGSLMGNDSELLSEEDLLGVIDEEEVK